MGPYGPERPLVCQGPPQGFAGQEELTLLSSTVSISSMIAGLGLFIRLVKEPVEDLNILRMMHHHPEEQNIICWCTLGKLDKHASILTPRREHQCWLAAVEKL